jgi:MFS family permease
LYVTAAISALGGLLFGYDTGIISGALLFIRDEFGLTDASQQVVGSLLLGTAIGALAGGPISDNIGRRRTVLVAAVIFVVGSIASALATGTAFLVVARFVLGTAVGAAGMIVPVYIAEISPSRVRGSLVSLNQLMITVGIMISYGVGFAFAAAQDWRLMLGLGARCRQRSSLSGWRSCQRARAGWVAASGSMRRARSSAAPAARARTWTKR